MLSATTFDTLIVRSAACRSACPGRNTGRAVLFDIEPLAFFLDVLHHIVLAELSKMVARNARTLKHEVRDLGLDRLPQFQLQIGQRVGAGRDEAETPQE